MRYLHWTPSIAGLAMDNTGMVLQVSDRYNSGNRILSSFDRNNNRDPRSNVTVLQRLMFETRSFSDSCNGDFKCKEQQGWSAEASGEDFPRDTFSLVNHFSSNSGKLNTLSA